MKKTTDIETLRRQKQEEKKSRKAFNYLVAMARRKDALVEVIISNRSIGNNI